MLPAKVPAWKRLGLQLKPSPDTPLKRKFADDRTEPPPPAKHARPATDRLSTPSSVTRVNPTERPTRPARPRPPAKPDKPIQQPKQTASSAQPSNPAATAANASSSLRLQAAPASFNFQPALDYLRQWRRDRAHWKFSKNFQTLLTKYVLSIPPADVDTFYDYIRDIKGFARIRLRDVAAHERDNDSASGSTGAAAAADKAQARYLSAVSGCLDNRKQFREAEYLVTTNPADPVVQRVVRRMRAELILAALDAEETGNTQELQQPAPSTSPARRQSLDAANEAPQPSKQPRRRKSRTADAILDLSSDSDSDSSDLVSDSDSDSD